MRYLLFQQKIKKNKTFLSLLNVSKCATRIIDTVRLDHLIRYAHNSLFIKHTIPHYISEALSHHYLHGGILLMKSRMNSQSRASIYSSTIQFYMHGPPLSYIYITCFALIKFSRNTSPSINTPVC